MYKYYVMQMFSGDFSPILKYTTTDPTLAFAVRDDLAKQYPNKTFAVLMDAAMPASLVGIDIPFSHDDPANNL